MPTWQQSARIATAKVLLIQRGPTMTLGQFKAAFMPSITDKAVRNRISRGDCPAMRDGMFDTQEVGDWWDSIVLERAGPSARS